MVWELTPVLAAEKKKIIFGYSAPNMGTMAYSGEKTKEGYTTWAEMVEKKFDQVSTGCCQNKFCEVLLINLPCSPTLTY